MSQKRKRGDGLADEVDYRHIMSWLMFLLIWLIFIEVYSGEPLLDIGKYILSIVFFVMFLFDVRRYL